MRQNEVPPASRLLNSTEAKQDLLGVPSIERMVKWGAPVRAEERKFLLDYLSAYYGPQGRWVHPRQRLNGNWRHISDPPIYTGQGRLQQNANKDRLHECDTGHFRPIVSC